MPLPPISPPTQTLDKGEAHLPQGHPAGGAKGAVSMERRSTEVRMVRIDRSLTAAEQDALLGLLPPVRQMGRPTEKQTEALWAYGLLLALLRERYGRRTLPDVARSAAGKPYFPSYPTVCFSLSHTEGAAAAAVSDAPVGVDIQRVRPLSDRARRRAPSTAEAFFRDWVRWEARAKRTGGGLLTMVRREPPPAEGEVYTPLAAFPGYEAGVAAAEAVESVGYLTADDLLRALL